MSKVKIQGNASGTGVVTLTAPNTNTDRTITLPDSTATLATQENFTSTGIDDNATTTAITVTSVGDVQIGKTINDFGATAGTEIRKADGRVFVGSADGAFINRIGSDGNIIGLRKDGTTVGSIGSEGNGGTFFIGSGDVTLGFNAASDIIIPRGTNAANRTDAIDLGNSNNRFKDLYLSGGVYLGGTGAANHLDDYEEGTWTPAVYGGGSLTLGTTPMAKYVKIGSKVTVWFYISCNNNGNSVAMKISGLPYANNGGGNDYMMGSSINYASTNANLTNPHVRVQPNTTYLTFIKNQDSWIAQSELDASHVIGSATYTST